jgi:2-oxoglutarate dehydrogenase E1 component
VSGTVVKIHAAEGDTVGVGSVLAEIAPGANGAGPAITPDEPEAAAEEPEAGSGTVIEIEMPAMGESVSEGTILEWAKSPGDAVQEDETIVEISTDKVDAEVPAPASGTLTEVLADAGDTVTVGQIIARMTSGNGAAPAKVAPTPEPTETRPAGDTETIQTPEGLKVTPVAQRVAAAQGIDLARVRGTGPNGRIGKADVLAFQENGAAAAPAKAAPAEGKQTLLKGASAMLARYMDESRAIPTATSFRTFTVTNLDTRRKQLKEAGHRVSFTHLIAHAIARAATEQMPVMATHFAELDGKPHVIDDGGVHLGIAVDVEKKGGGRTLMVPVIKDAGRLTFPQFLDAFGVLITKARENKLTADDLQGANVSLTNPGGIGTIASVPRLMNGQGTIVATGSIAYPPGLAAIGATIGAEKVMTMTSTYDHRIIQGAESGQFLQVVEAYLQGEHGFYEQVFADLGAEIGPAPTAPTPTSVAVPAPAEVTAPAPAVAAEPNLELLQAVQAAMSLIKAHRTHGHLAARLDPLGSEPEGDPALDPEPLKLTPEIMAKIPASTRMWAGIASVGLVMALVTLFTIDVFLPGGLVDGNDTLEVARTAGFTTLVLAQLFNSLNARSETTSAFHGLFANRWLWAAILLAVVLQVAVVQVPFLQVAFGAASMDLAHWGTCVALASVVLWYDEARKLVLRRFARRTRTGGRSHAR